MQNCVILKDVDDDVFARFAQFLYTGAYTSPAPTGRDDTAGSEASATATTIGALHFSSSPFGNFGGPAKNDKYDSFKLPCSLASYLESCKTAAGRTHNLFCSRKFDSLPCRCDFRGEDYAFKEKRNTIEAFMAKQGGLAGANCHGILQTRPVNQSKTSRHVFIGHARVWVFADKYGVSSLKDHAFSCLVIELAHWTISASAFIPEFGRIVRYVYDCHTIGGRLLRNLMAQFAACVVEDVSCLDGWRELLNEMPDFTVDLVNETTNRLV